MSPAENNCAILKTISILAIGFFAALAIGYCIYFDQQRRSDPNFRRRLRERRRAAASQGGGQVRRTLHVEMPDPNDQDAVLRFFLDQVRSAEEKLAMGDMDGGVEHLSYAVRVCAQPGRFMQSIQITLPPEVYQKLLQILPENLR